MSFFDPPKTVNEYVNKNTQLYSIYRKAGYDKFIDKNGTEAAKAIYSLVESQEDNIPDYSKVYKNIADNIEADTKEDAYKDSVGFESQIQKIQTENPEAAIFIKELFKNISELEKLYTEKWNPLTDDNKQEILDSINLIKHFFVEGYGMSQEAWKLQDHIEFAFTHLGLEEDFGNKREEFEFVVNTLLGAYESRRKEKRERISDLDFIQRELLKASKLYTESSWMHTSVLTVDLLLALFEIETFALTDALAGHTKVGDIKLGVSVVALSLSWFYPWILLIGGIFIILYAYSISKFRKAKKVLDKIKLISSEIAIEGYDGDTINNRLKRIEEDHDIYCPSIIFSLLKLKHSPTI